VRGRARWALLALAFAGFVGLGLPDGLLGVAWPEMRAEFALPQGALGALLAALTAGYVLGSFGAGALLRRLRAGPLLAGAFASSAAASSAYAVAPSWLALAPFGLFAGLGAGAIDTAGPALVAGALALGAAVWRLQSLGLGLANEPAGREARRA